MSDLSFRRGEILTAEKLNQLVQAVTSGAPSAAVGNGNVSPAQPHQVRQREFSNYVPIRRPVYIDQTSPHWPLVTGGPGWYWRESELSALTPFPYGLGVGDSVFLKTELSPWGVVLRQTPQADRVETVAWDPFQEKNGVLCEKLGMVVADPYKTGTKATTLRFFEAPASPVVPVLAASAPSTRAKIGWVPDFMPPASYLTRASLLGRRIGNTQLLNNITNDGGLIFKYFNNSELGVCTEGVEIIPRLAILPAPSTAPPESPGDTELGSQLAPGTWHEMAAVNIAGQRLALNMAWLNPWMAYINMSVAGAPEPIHQTWKKGWGMPDIAAPASPFDLAFGTWREVSRTSPNVLLIHPDQLPEDCAWLLREEKILQAQGTYSPGTDENGDTIVLPAIFQAYLRRQLAPATACWCIWYDECWTNLYD